MRLISYGEAIQEAFEQMMDRDPLVFLLGQGVTSPWYVGNTTRGLAEKFGKERIIDTPVSENSITGAGIGAALAGMRPVVIHPRMDFMLLAAEEIINQAANWYYMFGGRLSCPVTIRSIINRGGEQGCQHSQALQAMYAHIPGLKVVMPATPYDAKGLLIAAIQDPNPVIYIDDRWLYNEEGDVLEKMYSIPLGKGVVRRKGNDLTLVAISFMVREAVKAADELEGEGIRVEVIDPRTLKPLDEELIIESVKKTGRLIIAEAAWLTGGFAGEIAACIAQKAFHYLKAPIVRVTLPDVPAPMSSTLEKEFYIGAEDIVNAVNSIIYDSPKRKTKNPKLQVKS